MFQRLPIHWMWWPAIGAVVVGIGGVIDPRVLGVGYDTIHSADARGNARRGADRPVDRQSAGLGGRAGFRHVRRRAGARC